MIPPRRRSIPWVIGILGAFVFSTPALSLGLVRQVTTNEARNGVPITVWEAGGTTIDFSNTGEIIRRVWLDDPSRVTLDFDGDMNESGGGAYIIHLRRVLGVSFESIPRTATTLLTVVTVDGSDQRRIYLFQVSYASGSPSYSTVRVSEPAPPQTTRVALGSGEGRTDLAAVEAGLRSAIAQQIITEDSPVVGRVNAFLSDVRNGTPPASAAASAGVSMNVLTRLAQMGATATASTTATATTATAETATPVSELDPKGFIP